MAAVGGLVSGFWSRYAVEHVCLVGFIRRRLDVHRSDRERKHRGGTLRTRGLRGSALRLTSTEESLKGYIFIV